MITASVGKYATDVVDWVAQRATKQNNRPFSIRWECSDDKMRNEFLAKLAPAPYMSLTEAKAMVGIAGDHRVLGDVADYLDRQRRAKGRTQFTALKIETVIRQSFANKRRFGTDNIHAHWAMTVYGAKNRKFDNVVVLWPAAIMDDAEDKRRLLYSATTRAKSRCLVLVQSRDALTKPPFVAAN